MEAAESVAGVRRFTNVDDRSSEALPVVLDDGQVLLRTSSATKRRRNPARETDRPGELRPPAKSTALSADPPTAPPAPAVDEKLLWDKIGAIAASVLADPERKIGSVDDIHRIAAAAGKAPPASATTRQLALLTQMQLLIDLWPGYRIHPDKTADADQQQQLSKDVVSQLKYERRLVAAYNRLVDLVVALVRPKRGSGPVDQRLTDCALTVMTTLLADLPQAAEGDRLLRLILMHIEDSRRPAIRKTAVDTAKQVLTSLAQLSSEGLTTALCCVKTLTGIIKKKKGIVRAEVLEPLPYLDLGKLQSRIAILEKGHVERTGPRGRKYRNDPDAATKERDLNKAVKEGIATVTAEEARKAFVTMTELLCTAYIVILMKFADEEAHVKASTRNTSLASLLKGLAALTPFLRPEVVDSILHMLPEVLLGDGLRPRLRLECLASIYQIVRAHHESSALGDPDNTITVPSSSPYDLLLAESLQAIVEDIDVVTDGCLVAAARAVFACVDRRTLPRDVIAELRSGLFRLAAIAASHRPASLIVHLAEDTVMVRSVAASHVMDDTDDEESHPDWNLVLLGRHYHPLVRELPGQALARKKLRLTGLTPDDRRILTSNTIGVGDMAEHATTFDPPIPTTRPGIAGQKKKKMGKRRKSEMQ